MSKFKFKLGQQVQIQVSAETGEVTGRAQYAATENTYQMRYKSADGRAVSQWWEESALAVSDVNLVPSQTLQSGSIGGPGAWRVGGNTPIVVEVYTLGRGIAIKAESSNLLGREGAFELEAFDKFFTFDVAGAIRAQGLIAPIQDDVAAVSLPLQAIDQKDVADLERHYSSFIKTVIVGLPAASGKTTLAEQMMAHFGCISIVDGWCNRDAITPGALHLTNQPLFVKE
jgi:hypothetical protein